MAIEALRNGLNVDFIDRIINEIDKPCQANIVNEAKESDSNITELLNITFGGNIEFPLIYRNELLPTNADGTTPLARTNYSWGNNNSISDIEIIFNNKFLDKGTDIAIFSTTLHENVHAILIQLVDKGVITTSNQNLDYIILAEEWAKIEADRRLGGTRLTYRTFCCYPT